MILVKGYECLSYNNFQRILYAKRVDSNKSIPEIAVCCGIKHTHTINNCFNINKQVAKDSVVTKLMNCLGVDGFILWKDGERLYYIK